MLAGGLPGAHGRRAPAARRARLGSRGSLEWRGPAILSRHGPHPHVPRAANSAPRGRIRLGKTLVEHRFGRGSASRGHHGVGRTWPSTSTAADEPAPPLDRLLEPGSPDPSRLQWRRSYSPGSLGTAQPTEQISRRKSPREKKNKNKNNPQPSLRREGGQNSETNKQRRPATVGLPNWKA